MGIRNDGLKNYISVMIYENVRYYYLHTNGQWRTWPLKSVMSPVLDKMLLKFLQRKFAAGKI